MSSQLGRSPPTKERNWISLGIRSSLNSSSPITTVLGDILPPEAVLSVWEGDAEPALYPEEAAAVERAVPKRRTEFRRGRACAREALKGLGIPPGPIPVGEGRAPVWPQGTIGSITHCQGLIAAAVARTREICALGIDAEPARALPGETRRLILHPSEHYDNEDSVLEAVVFSAKEAIHKTLFPVSGISMDFLDVVVRLDPAQGRFTAAAASDAAVVAPQLARLRGRFAVAEDVILTVGSLDPFDLGGVSDTATTPEASTANVR